MQVNRRLYRCSHDKRIAGVASGLAEYFDIDPSLVRVLWVLSIFFGGLGILAYIAMAIIVPLEPQAGFAPPEAGFAQPGFAPAGEAAAPTGEPTGEPGVPAGPVVAPIHGGWHTMPAEHRHAARGTGRATTIFGIVLILFGALALVDTYLPAWADNGRFLWPAFIVGLGALLVVLGLRREPTAS
jgi:phage shock protein PspC (stress-responsive transcriptional regulator)